jgi:hypothetical protein
MGWVAYTIPAVIFLHLASPVAVFGGFVKKNYGAITFVGWLALSLQIALSVFNLFFYAGLLASLAAAILGWMVPILLFAFVSNRIFGFPPIPRI